MCPRGLANSGKTYWHSMSSICSLYAFLLSKRSANVPTICKAPSFCLGSAFGDVKTCIIKCTVFCNMSFLCLHEVCSNDWAAVTGDTKSSNISNFTRMYSYGSVFQSSSSACEYDRIGNSTSCTIANMCGFRNFQQKAWLTPRFM